MEGRKEWHIEVGAPSKKASNSFIISFEISFTVNKMLKSNDNNGVIYGNIRGIKKWTILVSHIPYKFVLNANKIIRNRPKTDKEPNL